MTPKKTKYAKQLGGHHPNQKGPIKKDEDVLTGSRFDFRIGIYPIKTQPIRDLLCDCCLACAAITDQHNVPRQARTSHDSSSP